MINLVLCFNSSVPYKKQHTSKCCAAGNERSRFTDLDYVPSTGNDRLGKRIAGVVTIDKEVPEYSVKSHTDATYPTRWWSHRRPSHG
jgi:hypothetical protein